MYVLEWLNAYGDTQVARLRFDSMTDRQWAFMFDKLSTPNSRITRIETSTERTPQ